MHANDIAMTFELYRKSTKVYTLGLTKLKNVSGRPAWLIFVK